MSYKILTVTAFAATLTVVAPVKAENVVLYTGNSTHVTETYVSHISKVLPDITVSVVHGNTGALTQRLRAEAGNPQADLFGVAGFATLGAYADVFQPHNSDATAALPETMIGPDGLWTGTDTHVMVLMINERALRGMEAPSTWSDIFNSEWEGKIVMADPELSSSAYAQVYGLYQLFGEDGLNALAKVVTTTSSTSQAWTSVAAGEYPVSITMEYAAHQYGDGGQDEIKLVYPTEGTFLSPGGFGIIAGAPNRDAAAKVMDVISSAEMQEIVFRATFRRPVNPDVDVTAIAGLPAMPDIKIIHFDQLQAAEDYEEVTAIWRAAKDAAGN